MGIVLGPNEYGKAQTRLVHIDRAGADHALTDLAAMVPFGDTPEGLEVALELCATTGPRVVWLDPAGFDSGDTAIVAVEAASVEAYVASRLGDDPRVASR